MKGSTVALIAVGGLIALSYFNLGVTGATMQVVLQNVQFNSLTDWVITLYVQNVSNSAIQVNSLNGTVSVNGTNIGNVSDFSGSVQVPANSQTAVNVHFSPSLLSIPGIVATFVQGIISGNPTGETLNFEVQGFVNVNGNVIPYDEKKTVTA